jgi:type III pantothenate kinase
MLFVVDVGNTNIVFGIYSGESLISSWRVATRKQNTADEYGILIAELFQHAELKMTDIKGVIVSCVVPPLVSTFTRLTQRYFGIEAINVGPGIKTGMPILYDNPKEVGADRIVNAVAGHYKYKKSLIIVDFGTATTFDAVSLKGEYLGGAIAPGINISMDALFLHAAKLPRVEFARPKSVIGKNTIHSIQAGIYYGYVGVVDGIVTRIKEELGTDPYVIGTGGLANLIAKDSKTLSEVDENLTLEGLRILYDLNTKPI